MARDLQEEIKKRHIRNLKKGHKKTISPDVIQKYNWTDVELKFLEPFINNTKPFEITNTSSSSDCFTKNEVYQLLEEHVTNQTTFKNYKSRTNALLTLMKVENECFSDIFQDVHKLIKTICENYLDPTSYFGFLLFVLSKNKKLLDVASKYFNKTRRKNKTEGDDVFDTIKKQFNEYKTKQTVNQLNDRRSDLNYATIYKTIFEKEKELNAQEYASTRHLIATMYTHALYDEKNTIHINPRNYFHCVKLVNADDEMDDEHNFYNITTGRLLLNDYKTSAIYNPYDVVLTSAVQKVIKDSIQLKPRAYLIEKSKGNCMAPNSLSELVKRIFGYTIDDIRKSIESYEINVKKTDRTHLATVSRHTVLTQEVSYLAQTSVHNYH